MLGSARVVGLVLTTALTFSQLPACVISWGSDSSSSAQDNSGVYRPYGGGYKGESVYSARNIFPKRSRASYPAPMPYDGRRHSYGPYPYGKPYPYPLPQPYGPPAGPYPYPPVGPPPHPRPIVEPYPDMSSGPYPPYGPPSRPYPYPPGPSKPYPSVDPKPYPPVDPKPYPPVDPKPYPPVDPKSYPSFDPKPYPPVDPKPYPPVDPKPYPPVDPKPYPPVNPKPYPPVNPIPYPPVDPKPYPPVDPKPYPPVDPKPYPPVDPKPYPPVDPRPYPPVDPKPYPPVDPKPYPPVDPKPYPPVNPIPYPPVNPKPYPPVNPKPYPPVNPKPYPSVDPKPYPPVYPIPYPAVNPKPYPPVQVPNTYPRPDPRPYHEDGSRPYPDSGVYPRYRTQPTRPAKPTLPLNLCDNCRFKNGVGYNQFPNSCQHYVTCQPYKGYKLWPTKMSCPYNLFWSQKLLTCVRPKETKCRYDPCMKGGKTVPVYGNCAAYHVCNGYKYTSAIYCCAYGHRYQPGYGYNKGAPCVKDPTCLDTCAPKKTPIRKERCRLYAVKGYPYKYQELVHGRYLLRYCAPGSAFVQNDCGCTARVNIKPKPGCNPEVHIDFKYGIRDVSGNHVAIGNEWNKVKSVKTSAARDGFAGEFHKSQLILWRFANAPMGPGLKITFNFLEKQIKVAGNGGPTHEVLVNNGDCRKDRTVSIAFDRSARTVSGHLLTKAGFNVTVTVPYAPGEFKQVVYTYDGKYLSLTVNSQSLQKTKSIHVKGEVVQSQCALSLGSVKGAIPFYGLLDEFKLFLCAPKPVQYVPKPGTYRVPGKPGRSLIIDQPFRFPGKPGPYPVPGQPQPVPGKPGPYPGHGGPRPGDSGQRIYPVPGNVSPQEKGPYYNKGDDYPYPGGKGPYPSHGNVDTDPYRPYVVPGNVYPAPREQSHGGSYPAPAPNKPDQHQYQSPRKANNW